MTARRLPALAALLGALALAVPVSAQGQFRRGPDNPSHGPIDVPGADLGRKFQDRLREHQQQQAGDADLLKKLQDSIPPEKLAELVKDLQKNPDLQMAMRDPEFLKKMQDLVQKNPGLKDLARDLARDPKLRERLRDQAQLQGKQDPAASLDMLRGLMDKAGKPGSPDGPPDPTQPGGAAVTPQSPDQPEGPNPQSVQQGGQAGPSTPPEAPKNGGQAPPPPEPPAPPAPNPDQDNYRDLLKKLEKSFGKIGDSPQFQQTIRELERMKLGPSGDRMSGPLGDLQDLAKKAGQSLEGTKIKPPKWTMSGSGPKVPNFGGGPSVPAPSFGGPSLGGAGGAAVGGFGGGLIVFVAVGIALIVVAVLLRDLQRRRSGTDRGPAGLGPWPVDPARVADRGQLIQAFEYLGVKVGGQPARTWNHQVLARRLGTPDADRRAAAERLAGLYAESRYAPNAGPLPPEAVAGARRDLCLLAGVGPA